MAELLKSILLQATKDTIYFFEWKPRLLIVLLSFIIGSFVHYVRFGKDAFMDQLNVAFSYGLMGIGLCVLAIFFYNIIKDPLKELNKRQGIMIVGFTLILTLFIQLLPNQKLDFRNFLPSDEKDKVRLLITQTIRELQALIETHKGLLKSINENPDKAALFLDNNPIVKSKYFNDLRENDLFKKYCDPCFNAFYKAQTKISNTVTGVNNSSKLPQDRLELLKDNINLMELTKKQLQTALKLIDGNINKDEFVNVSQKLMYYGDLPHQ